MQNIFNIGIVILLLIANINIRIIIENQHNIVKGLQKNQAKIYNKLKERVKWK